jgi:hypothetical protein
MLVPSPKPREKILIFAVLRAIGLALLLFGPKAVALPCLATIVSYSYVVMPGGMSMDVFHRSDQNPEAFADAYWEVNSLRIYSPQANRFTTSSSRASVRHVLRSVRVFVLRTVQYIFPLLPC